MNEGNEGENELGARGGGWIEYCRVYNRVDINNNYNYCQYVP